MSLPITDTLDILRAHLSDATLIQQIAKDLIQAEKEVKAEKAETPKRGKTRLVALVRQDPGSTALGGAYLISVPDAEDEMAATYNGEALLNRLRKAAAEHNDGPRGRKKKVKIDTWATFFQHIKAKTLKQSGSQISLKAKGNAHELVVLSSESIQP